MCVRVVCLSAWSVCLPGIYIYGLTKSLGTSMAADGWWPTIDGCRWSMADGVQMAVSRFIEAYCLCHSYTQIWNDSSWGYLVHGPYAPRYTCLHIRKWTKLNRLSDCLTHCIQRSDLNFMEIYGLYYSYTQYWTHSSKGYLVHGTCFPRCICLDIRKCTKFKRLSHYLIRCVQRADFHFMEAYGLYYSYN